MYDSDTLSGEVMCNACAVYLNQTMQLENLLASFHS